MQTASYEADKSSACELEPLPLHAESRACTAVGQKLLQLKCWLREQDSLCSACYCSNAIVMDTPFSSHYGTLVSKTGK